MTPADAEPLVVRRVLRVPRARVFAAWLDPALMSRWMCPGDTSHATVELDPRVGGKFRIVMHHARGEAERSIELPRIARERVSLAVELGVQCLMKVLGARAVSLEGALGGASPPRRRRDRAEHDAHVAPAAVVVDARRHRR